MKAVSEVLVSAKNFSGKYILCNDAFLQKTGFTCDSQLLGRHEYDVCDEIFVEPMIGVDELAEQFLKEDEVAFKGQELNIFYAVKWRGILRFLMANKLPYRNEKEKIIGAMSSLYEVFNPSLKLLKTYLTSDDENLIISDACKNNIHWYLNDFLKNIPLNQRELECVNLLAKGKTAKEIGIQLNLSYRTVEFYLDNARLKLQCTNRYELIAACLNKGWLDIETDF